jgi:hypothetical protein
MSHMGSPQALSESDRRIVAAWAAACAERVLALFEAQAPGDRRPRDATPGHEPSLVASLPSPTRSAGGSSVAALLVT